MVDVTKIDKEKMLQDLECPFTWNVRTKEKHEERDDSAGIDDQMFPLPKFLHNVMSVYMSMNNKDFEIVNAKLQKCKDDLSCIERKAHPQISLKVAQHIVQATEIHVLNNYGKTEEFETQLHNVTFLNENDMNSIEKGTLEACKSIAWSHNDLIISIDFIRKAIQHNPKCDLWHYSLGKELRRLRRDKNIKSPPSQEEFNCFKKSFDLDHNPLCGVMYAQALRECKRFKDAQKKYYDIYYETLDETRADEAYILLKLALGFIQCRHFSKAKECLDRVAAKNLNEHLLYLHYRGMYHMKMGQFKEAVPFLERAITEKHFGVEKQWLYCKVQADRSFDATNDVLKMIEKYKDFPVNIRQHLQLELAMCHEKNNEDMDAIKCFIKAIEMNRETGQKSSTLEHFDCCVNRTESRRDVYKFLKNDFLPRVLNQNIPTADTLERLVYEN